MLQTDAHNPQIKDKMTLNAYKLQLTGCNSGEDLDEIFIQELYNSIIDRPITLDDDEELKEKMEGLAIG